MKVVLLRCPSPFLIDEKVFPPLGLLAVGTALQENGCDVTVQDDPSVKADWYGLGPATSEYATARGLLRDIRNNHPAAKVMIGGPHASVYPERCLQDGFDLVCVGDGECLTRGMLLSGGIVHPSALPLDSYPTIDRDLLLPGIHHYHYLIDGVPATSLVTARGCPYGCGFCAKQSDRVRFRSAEYTIREIGALYYSFGYKALMFFDDTFIIKPGRVRTICDCLKKLGIIWRCFVRADLVVKHGRDLVQYMADSGCVEVGMGVESGSDTILKAIGKGETVDDVRLATRLLDAYGIRVKGLFIIGLPGESPETLKETERLVDELPFSDLDFTIFQPYAGSPIYEHKQDYDIDWDELPWENSHYKGRPGEYQCRVWTSSLSSDEIESARDDLERRWKGAA